MNSARIHNPSQLCEGHMRDRWVLFGLLLLLILTTANAITDTNLKGYWKLDEITGNPSDSSTNGVIGTSSNIFYDATGKINRDFNFVRGSSSHIDFNDSTYFIPSNYTFCFWNYLLPSIGGNIITRAGSTPTDLSYIIASSTDAKYIHQMYNTAGTGYTIQSGAVSTNTWHFVCASKDNTKLYLWIDNVTITPIAWTGSTYTGAKTMIFGGRVDGATYLSGKLDEVSFWDRNLSASDVSYLYKYGAGLTYPFPNQFTHVDFNYIIRKDLNQILLKDMSVAYNVNNTAWTWKANGTTISTTQDYNYTALKLTDYNICLHVDTNQSDINGDKCYQFNTGDWTAPTTTFTSNQVANTTNQNITLTCTDNNSGCKYINYKIDNDVWNYKSNLILNDLNTNYITDAGSQSHPLYLTDYTTVATYIIPNSNYNYTVDANGVFWASSIGYGPPYGYAKLKYNYIDSSIDYSNEVSFTAGGAQLKNFSTDSNISKSLLSIELQMKHSFEGSDVRYSDISILYKEANKKYNFLFSGAGNHNIQYFSTDNADNNEAIKTSQFPMFVTEFNQTEQTIKNIGATQYNGYAVTSWNWIKDGVSSSTDSNYLFYSSENQDFNICLTTSNGSTIDTTCKTISSWNTIAPTISVTTNQTYGFVSTFNIDYNMRCYDDKNQITYNITKNEDGNITTIYNSLDSNASLKSGIIPITQGKSGIITFTCTDDWNNQAHYTTNQYYALRFRLVNENNGGVLTTANLDSNFSIARVYTPDGLYDFNLFTKTDVNFFSPSNTLFFEFGYKDTPATKISRQINFQYTGADANICTPYLQTFFQQRFVSNSSKIVILKNNVSQCYVFADQLKYVYDTGYSHTTYTILKPYYLYTYIDGLATYLALIDGGVSTQYNIDAIQFSRTAFDITVGVDTVAFEPLLNTITNKYDTNTIQIYYKSWLQDNASTTLTVYNGTNQVFTITNTDSPNELLLNFYYGGLGITDENVLKLRVYSINSLGEVSDVDYYFTTNGANYKNKTDNSWAVIAGILFFIFGLTLVSVGRIFGFFGILVCIVSIALTAFGTNAWWISLIQASFFIILIFLVLSGKQTGRSVLG
jgi:hypothetical protein